MKAKVVTSLLYFGSIQFIFSQEVKRITEVIPQGSMMYYQGRLYTGQVVDFDGNKFDKNKLRFYGQYINGKPNGHIKKWYPNYKLEFDENYGVGGSKEGTQIYYYDNGKIREKLLFKRGKLSGMHSSWYDNGKRAFEKNYLDDLPIGKWMTYDENEKVVSIEEYRNGQIVSEVLYTDGRKNAEKFYTKGAPNGKWVNYDETEKVVSETEYQNGNIIKELLYEKGKLSSEKYYSGGVPDGKWSVYDENNQLKSESVYDNGKLISQKHFKNNMPHGVWKTSEGNRTGKILYNNGVIITESNFLDDKPDGKQIEYLDSSKKKETNYKYGEKISEGNLLNNKQHGKWIYWSDNGSRITVKIYKSGELIREEKSILTDNIISNIPTNENTFLVKIDNYEKPFIRVDLRLGQTRDQYTQKVIEVIRDECKRPTNRLSKVYPDGSYKDESINYIIEFYKITVMFGNVNCTSLITGQKNYGYSATIEMLVFIKDIDEKNNEAKTITATTQSLLLTPCYPSYDEALAAALKKDFIGKFIDKNFSTKRK